MRKRIKVTNFRGPPLQGPSYSKTWIDNEFTQTGTR